MEEFLREQGVACANVVAVVVVYLFQRRDTRKEVAAHADHDQATKHAQGSPGQRLAPEVFIAHAVLVVYLAALVCVTVVADIWPAFIGQSYWFISLLVGLMALAIVGAIRWTLRREP